MTLDAFLDLLENVRSSGAGYKAICPAHDDRESSLGVSEGDDGRILVRCYAGCETSKVLDEMKLTMRDLFPHSSVNHAEPEAIYPYVDEEGQELFQAVRLPGKRFRQRHRGPDDEWVWNMEGVRRVLYRLPDVIEAVAAGKTVYIVEGEKDAENLYKLGKTATCNPMGAGKWREEFAPYFAGANVIIVVDRDEPGRVHAEKVRASLVPFAKGIYMRQAKRGKDVSDHLAYNLRVEELVPLRTPSRRGIVTVLELVEDGIELLDAREGDVPRMPIIEGLPIELRAGRMYSLGAYTGDGKTTLALQATRTLCTDGRKGGYFSLEMGGADLRNRLVAHRGIPPMYTEQPWKIAADPDMKARYEMALEELKAWNLEVIFKTDTTADFVASTARDREYDFIVVDHVHRTQGDRAKLTEEVQQYTNLALELNVPVLLLCQLRKYERGKDRVAYPRPTLQDFRETSQIADDSSMALGLWRQRDSSGLSFVGTQTELIIFKNRYITGPHDTTNMSYWMNFDPKTQRYSRGVRQHGEAAESGTLRAGAEATDAGGDGGRVEEEAWYYDVP